MYGTDRKNWYRIVCLDIEDAVKQRYSWHTSVRSWKRDFKEELYDTDFYYYITITIIIIITFVWMKQQEHNLRKRTKLVINITIWKDRIRYQK